MNETIEVEAEQLALATKTDIRPVKITGPLDVTPPKEPLTPAQARVESVADVLAKARANASMLKLTPEEVKLLKAEFPDDAFKMGAGGDPNLLYIEHAFLRDRFDEALGMCQWALIRSRPHWPEEYTTGKGEKAVRIYADCALVIRGSLVAEAIGEMSYFPNNAKTNYGDAVEGSETAAFRRCAKKIGVGLQAWKKDFCEGWKQRKHSPQYRPAVNPAPVATAPHRPQQPAGAASSADSTPIAAFNETKFRKDAETWLESEKVKWVKENTNPKAWTYMVVEGMILPTEQMNAVTWHRLWSWIHTRPGDNHPTTCSGETLVVDAMFSVEKRQTSEAGAKRSMLTKLLEIKSTLAKAIEATGVGDDELRAFESVYGKVGNDRTEPEKPQSAQRKEPTKAGASTEAAPAEWFWDVIISVPRKGQKKAEYEKNPDTIRSLYHDGKTGDEEARKRLWGLAQKMDLQPREFNGKTYPPSEADKQTRKALDAFLAWEEAKGKQAATQMRTAAEDAAAEEAMAQNETEPPF